MARLEGIISSSGWNILIILSCLGLIVMFDETMILPAIPDFIHKFNISYNTSSWLLSAYIIAARTAQGIGMAMFPIAFGIIREILPEKKLAIGQTIFSSTFSGGAVVGLVVGATIIQNFGWQATFFSIFPIAVILGLIIRRLVHIRNPATLEAKMEGGEGGGNDEEKKNSINTQTID